MTGMTPSGVEPSPVEPEAGLERAWAAPSAEEQPLLVWEFLALIIRAVGSSSSCSGY
jgi:hypothetical protein